MNTTHSNETHEALLSTSSTLELSDEMLMMITGGGEESLPVRESFLHARVREVLDGIADALSGSSPEPGPSDGAHGTGSSSGGGGGGASGY